MNEEQEEEDDPSNGYPSPKRFKGFEGSPLTNDEELKGNEKSKTKISNSPEELRDVDVTLEGRDLWERFNELGTEMIITKSGR